MQNVGVGKRQRGVCGVFGVGWGGVGVGCLAESKNAAVLVLWYNQKTGSVRKMGGRYQV